DLRRRLDRAVRRPCDRGRATVLLQGPAVPPDRSAVAARSSVPPLQPAILTAESAAAARTAADTASCRRLSSGSGTSSSPQQANPAMALAAAISMASETLRALPARGHEPRHGGGVEIRAKDALDAVRAQQPHDAGAGGAEPDLTDAARVEIDAGAARGVDERRERHHRRAVLIVVQHRYGQPL